MLDELREDVDPLLTFLAKRFLSLSPNLVTWLSLVFAILAGAAFFFSTPKNERHSYFLCMASFFVFLNGFMDAIDGKIAKMKGKASPEGDFLDHAIDRFSDVSMLIGLSLSQWCDDRLGILAISGVLLTSYMGTQAQAVGYGRIYKGLLGRADRLLLLVILPLVQHFFTDFEWHNFNLLEGVLLYFAIVGFITSIQRFYITVRWFKRRR